jgi:UDP-3-O-[3-hydroxymyristoyl] glucosamine N-acyltransferase
VFYKDHTTIGDGAIVGAGSGVTGDIPAGKPTAASHTMSRKRLVNESKNSFIKL